METVYLNGNACHTCGNVPRPGDKAPCFTLTGKDLADVCCCDYKGKIMVLNIFPSLDTPVCAMSVRRFNKEAADLTGTAVICVSMDLPFAQSRFCETDGIDNLTVASAFRSPEFAESYGLLLTDGPLKGLLARAVIIIKDGKVIYTDLVKEITEQPDYATALDTLKQVMPKD